MATNGLSTKEEKALSVALANLTALEPVSFYLGGEARELRRLTADITARINAQDPETLLADVDKLLAPLREYDWAKARLKAA